MISTRTIRAAWLCALLAGGCRGEDTSSALPPPAPPPHEYPNCWILENRTRICDPSLAELIIRPEWYDGAIVAVRGVLDPADREGFALFASEDAYRMYVARSAVLLNLTHDLALKDFHPFDGGWVVVRGKYLARGRGSEGKFGGVIVDVESIFPYKSSRVAGPALRK